MSAGMELRIYRCPGPAQLARLNAMLGEDGLAMFARHGIEVVDAFTVAVGAATPVLIYLCPFDSMQARADAWASVDADADWQETKKRHGAGIGPLTSQLEFWWLEGVTPLRLPGDSAEVDLVSAPCPVPGLDGRFTVVYGPAQRTLAFAPPEQVRAADLPPGGRLVRLRRVGWSPAAGVGVTWGAEPAEPATVAQPAAVAR